MNLQLVDGSLNNPIGVVEDIIMESCGIEYENTCSIVDFGMNTTYKVILGLTFMHQFKMFQDSGFDYLYLRQETFWVRLLCTNSKCFKIGILTTCTLDKKHL